MNGRSRTWINGLLRRGLLLLLVIPVQRYLSGLMPLGLPVALFAAAVVTERALPPRRGAAVVSALLIPVTVVATAALLWIAAGPLERGGWWERQFVLIRWHLLPAAVIAELLFLWDRWVRRRPAGRMLFVPAMTLTVVVVFWSQARFELSLFSHPSWYAGYAVLTAMGLLAYQATSGDVRARLRWGVVSGSILLLALLVVFGVAFRGWQARAVEAGGGLLRPTAFQFDFADYVSLEPEISLSRDLVFLYREAHAPPDRLLRRYVLSGYSPRRGFYRRDATDEPSPVPPLSVEAATGGALPGSEPPPITTTPPTLADQDSPPRGASVDQEYYIVNFDPDALIAVNTPREVTRLQGWSDSSFNNAYVVSSVHPADDERALAEVEWPDDLPPAWREAYLQGPVPEGVAALAREITAEVDGYYDTVQAVLNHLLNEYYYSLSPGESPAGNQLEHFLFESRKGYCSYFAFSMTLMLRSLNVPSRVAVGFFTDPSAGMLEFYPVRGDMAHAWVEVWFDGIGWVEFDPTSQRIAPGETLATDYHIDREHLSELVQEILTRGGDAAPVQEPPGDAERAAEPPRTAMALWGAAVGGVLLLSLWWYRRRRRWRAVRRSDPRRAALLIIRRARRVRVRPAGNGASGGDRKATGCVPVETEERARFAPTFSYAELQRLESVLPVRVVRSVEVFPPGVPSRPNGSGPVSRRHHRAGASLGLLVIVMVLLPTSEVFVPAQPVTQESADELLQRAETAVQRENYQQALQRIRRGRERFPEDHRFPLLQGDLFFDQNVFAGARDAYRDALTAGAPDYATRYALSRALARLNEDQAALTELEELHRRYPDDLTVIGDLSWQYFKLQRLSKARRLLKTTLEGNVGDRDLMMTLATVYSGEWNFSAAEETYRAAIDEAERVNDQVFQAVAYYNLSILYANFHRYDDAYAAAERSLETADRSSGYMIRGELRELERGVVAAADDYRRAAALDEVSPLAELSLASLWVDAGYPEQAIARLDRITENDTGNWMYNYGTDPDRYQRQVYTAYAKAYEALAHQLRLQRPGAWRQRLAVPARMVAARARAWFYRGLERRQRLTLAESYAAAGRELLALWSRMIAAEHRPAVALRHAAAAEAIETAFNPAAQIEYQVFTAGITDDGEALSRLLPELRGRWDRNTRATALRGIYRARGADRRGIQAATEAWVLSPGEMVTNGLRVPVAIGTVDVNELSEREASRVLERMGFVVTPESSLVLELTAGDGALRYVLRERRSSRDVRRGRVRHGGGRKDLRRALEEVALQLTRAEDAVIQSELPVQ
ncbi:MAG: transglutaminase domain-containing protein [Alkalispirochaeta sp.]